MSLFKALRISDTNVVVGTRNSVHAYDLVNYVLSKVGDCFSVVSLMKDGFSVRTGGRGSLSDSEVRGSRHQHREHPATGVLLAGPGLGPRHVAAPRGDGPGGDQRDGDHGRPGQSGDLSLVQIPPYTVLSLVEPYYAGAKVYAITTHRKA